MPPSSDKSTADTPTTEKPARQAKANKAAKADKPARAAKPARGAAKSAAPVAAAPGAETSAAKPAAATETINLRNLVDSVAASTGMKKPEAKKSVEAVLAALGTGLAAKSMLNIPPLGKLRVAKAKGSVLTLKLRLSDASRAAGLALADDDEDS
jgi:hypothetical protein